jgi:hypothetical protein
MTVRPSSGSRWAIGVITGVIIGVSVLLTGVIGVALAVIAFALFAVQPQRQAPLGGLAIGLGTGWLLLLTLGDLACDVGCVAPDLGGWYALAAAFVAVGVVVTIRTFRRPSSAS